MLNGVDLQIPRGVIAGFLGPQRVGKVDNHTHPAGAAARGLRAPRPYSVAMPGVTL